MPTVESDSIPEIGALKRRLRSELPRLREKYGVEHLAVHGSRVREEGGPGSDLDVLVDFENSETGREASLLDFIALKQELEELLDVPVDLGERKALQGPAAEEILREAERI